MDDFGRQMARQFAIPIRIQFVTSRLSNVPWPVS